MTDYDIREALKEVGIDCTPGNTPIEGTNWEIAKATNEEISVLHPKGVSVQITQRKPKNGDLPYRVAKIGEDGEKRHLRDSDWINDVLEVAEAYMLGYAERDAE
jgi:hypothetical protein